MASSNSSIAVNGNYDFPAPASLKWGKQDISDSNSGRAQYTGIMYKNKIAEKIKLELSWNALQPNDVHKVLKAFNDEYFNLTYFDPLAGAVTTKEFYCGDMSAPVYMWTENNKIYSNVSFDVIER